MRIMKLSQDSEKEELLERIGSTKLGNKIMLDKMELFYFYIDSLKTPAGNILKQDALSVGAELVVEKDTILCKNEFTDALLIANKKQLKQLIKKMQVQPFGLKTLGMQIELHLKNELKEHDPIIMGIVNANDDSFYSHSRFSGTQAIITIEQMIEDGAGIIDIGAVSSRPGSSEVKFEDELVRLQDIVKAIYEQKLYERAKFSLDSYCPECLHFAFDHGFSIANDITAIENDEVARVISRYNASVVLMHMQGKPENMQNAPKYENVLVEVEDFFTQRIQKARDFGIEDIMLDVGLGFGKSIEHNLSLIKHQKHFQKFGLPILIGASRKSMIDKIYKSVIEERLPGTLILHMKALEEGASIIRCHDVKEHAQALAVYKALKGALI